MSRLHACLISCLVAAMSMLPTSDAPAATPVLVIHGGAGVERATLTAEEEAAARDALKRALLAGHALLSEGKPALDAVVAAIEVLEDDPAFNAGRGAARSSPTTAKPRSMPRSWTAARAAPAPWPACNAYSIRSHSRAP